MEVLSPAQFAGWEEFAAIEPWGFEIDDLRMGRSSHVVAAAAGAKDLEPKDFMLRPPEPIEEEVEDDVDQLKRLFGGRAK